jgi:hypothetical protein
MKDLLTSALDAHGGLSRWREIEAFSRGFRTVCAT